MGVERSIAVHGTSASAVEPTSPDVLFRTITTIAGLPTWSPRMTPVSLVALAGVVTGAAGAAGARGATTG